MQLTMSESLSIPALYTLPPSENIILNYILLCIPTSKRVWLQNIKDECIKWTRRELGIFHLDLIFLSSDEGLKLRLHLHRVGYSWPSTTCYVFTIGFWAPSHGHLFHIIPIQRLSFTTFQKILKFKTWNITSFMNPVYFWR